MIWFYKFQLYVALQVLAYTTEDKREFPLDVEVSLDTIKKFAQDFFEDKLYISGTVPESESRELPDICFLHSLYFTETSSIVFPYRMMRMSKLLSAIT
uniref:Uncharacterized protein n=1 Tax=Arundo donax TaxID=35708 RepID=A0A0A9E1X6_ARUDO